MCVDRSTGSFIVISRFPFLAVICLAQKDLLIKMVSGQTAQAGVARMGRTAKRRGPAQDAAAPGPRWAWHSALRAAAAQSPASGARHAANAAGHRLPEV